jgi:hypothetical protein
MGQFLPKTWPRFGGVHFIAIRRSRVRRMPGLSSGCRRSISARTAMARIPGAALRVGIISASHTSAYGVADTDYEVGTVPVGFQWFPNVAGPLARKAQSRLRSRATNRLPHCPKHQRQQKPVCLGNRPRTFQTQARTPSLMPGASREPGTASIRYRHRSGISICIAKGSIPTRMALTSIGSSRPLPPPSRRHALRPGCQPSRGCPRGKRIRR